MQLIDLTGMRFGQLLVLSRIGYDNDKRITWMCRCDCGVEIIKIGKRLKKAKELYCGDMHPTKICTICKKEKNKSTDYHKMKSKGCKNSISPLCKECRSEWYKQNQVALEAKRIAWMQDPEYRKRRKYIADKSRNKPENKVRASLQKLEYTNRPEVRARGNKIHQQRKLNDLNYNIKRRLRWRIRDAFKDFGLDSKKYKYKSSIVLLGCDMEFFKSYLESKFTEGMSWNRISEIHIDHIKPCSKFNLRNSEEQKACFNYKNLQPLWWQDNLIKSDKYNNLTSKDN